MNITIFGLGYVGCVGAGCLAEKGHHIVGVDIDLEKVKLINNGHATIVEKEIGELISKNLLNGRLWATSNSIEAIENSDAAIICVGTPNDIHGHLDMRFIDHVAEQIGEAIKNKEKFFTIAIRSTVMPGTNKRVVSIIEEKSKKKESIDFGVVSNPEFLREGSAVKDFLKPPYTIIASKSSKAIETMKKIYKNIPGEILTPEVESAELIKFVNNSFHALKVAFANEVGRLCKSIGVDSHNVMDLFIREKQLNISTYYFQPGFAYGGSCLPKDLKALNTIAHDNYVTLPILNHIDESNHVHINHVYNQIKKLNKYRIGFYSISFKSGTDDIRFSPALDLIERFLGKGYILQIFDKNVSLSRLMGKNKNYLLKKLPHINTLLCDDFERFLNTIDILVIVNKDKFIENAIIKQKELIILDLARVDKLKDEIENYIGVCW